MRYVAAPGSLAAAQEAAALALHEAVEGSEEDAAGLLLLVPMIDRLRVAGFLASF